MNYALVFIGMVNISLLIISAKHGSEIRELQRRINWYVARAPRDVTPQREWP
jgi:hypothetical protein